MDAKSPALNAALMNHAGLVEPKVWGTTQMLIRGSGFSLHRAVIKKGGKSSRHYHQARHNFFQVEKGRLKVTNWRDGLEESIIIGPGQSCCSPAGVEHAFEALSDVVLIEFYWAECDPHDIVRFSQGSVPKKKGKK